MPVHLRYLVILSWHLFEKRATLLCCEREEVVTHSPHAAGAPRRPWMQCCPLVCWTLYVKHRLYLKCALQTRTVYLRVQHSNSYRSYSSESAGEEWGEQLRVEPNYTESISIESVETRRDETRRAARYLRDCLATGAVLWSPLDSNLVVSVSFRVSSLQLQLQLQLHAHTVGMRMNWCAAPRARSRASGTGAGTNAFGSMYNSCSADRIEQSRVHVQYRRLLWCA